MLVVLCVCFFLVIPGTLEAERIVYHPLSTDSQLVSKISREIDLPPDSEYIIHYDAQNQTLYAQDIEPVTAGLSDHVQQAIAKAPRWIQPRLASQFQTLSDPEPYADVLLNASRQYADEIAFSIACCPTGRVPAAALLKENAESLYEHDQCLSYADIVEYDDGRGNYSSTIQYRVVENGTEKYYLLPSDIYYWYVVHPKIANEEIDAVYGPLWRNYLFRHNDLGYPLLKEKLSTIQYLWDCESYSQPAARLWSVCIAQHPTAIEAISYWIGKTVPNPAIGDRPGQASVIAHEHNGWCGELQKIAVAAQRTALIPSIPACNVGEDHVWREFYERGWHQNDNWWSDTGGAVDTPDVYAYGWGKNMSAIYQWRGDGTILQDTARYIHKEDRITVDFTVQNLFLQPIDGARIIVLVKGPKDITFYKNLLWEKIQTFWEKLPEFLKGKLLTLLFDRIQERFEKIPDIINGVTITTWNYTDSTGRCSIELGKNLDYLFLIQEGNLKKPWQLARHTTFRRLKTGEDTSFSLILMDITQKPLKMKHKDLPSGDCQFNLAITSSGYQLVKHFTHESIGRHASQGHIDCFFVDQENLQRYQNGQSFIGYHHWNGQETFLSVSTQNQDWYLILRNHNRQTHVVVDFSVDASLQTTSDHVQIVTPDTTLFETPIFCVGDVVQVSGVATTDLVSLSLGHTGTIPCPVVNGQWSYAWDTSGETLGTQVLFVESGGISDERPVLLIDAFPPSLTVDTPLDAAIVGYGILDISGHCSDNMGVDKIEVTLDSLTKVADGTTAWNLSWDLTGLPLGDHLLSVRAIDIHGLVSLQTRSFVLNESGHSWGPQINMISYSPATPTNTSNVIIYANVTSTGPFTIRTITLFCFDGTDTVSYEMYRYADFPVQSRHEEDPFYNESNDPIFGKELGQFDTGQSIGYWIVAVDTAGNRIQSEGDSFTII
jgi:hypothetical protein